MKVRYLILFVFFALIYGKQGVGRTKRRAYKYCSTNCTYLHKCEPFLELIQNLTPKIRREIRRNVCGISAHRVKVCCPTPSKTFTYFPSKCGNNPRVSQKIIFGENASMGEFPWAVAMGYSKPNIPGISFICSGSLINERYVLTAAHCVDPSRVGEDRKLVQLRIGDWDLSTSEDCIETYGGKKCAPMHINAQPEKIMKHPMYDIASDLSDDIALIRLDRTIDIEKANGYIMPICLPPFGINPRSIVKDDRPLIVIGWGNTEKGEPSNILLKGEIPFSDESKCKTFYFKNFGPRQICAGGNKVDSCQGDSGSPLMLAGPEAPPYLQVGIVSFGQICGSLGVPAVYTSVSQYRMWIENSMEPWDV